MIKDKKVIYKEELGGRKILGIYGEISEEERLKMKDNNIDISNIPLQKLFVYLTENMEKEAI